MLLDNGLGNAKAQSRALHFSLVADVGLAKLLEYLTSELLGNPDSSVRDLDAYTVLIVFHRDIDNRIFRRKLDSKFVITCTTRPVSPKTR